MRIHNFLKWIFPFVLNYCYYLSNWPEISLICMEIVSDEMSSFNGHEHRARCRKFCSTIFIYMQIQSWTQTRRTCAISDRPCECVSCFVCSKSCFIILCSKLLALSMYIWRLDDFVQLTRWKNQRAICVKCVSLIIGLCLERKKHEQKCMWGKCRRLFVRDFIFAWNRGERKRETARERQKVNWITMLHGGLWLSLNWAMPDDSSLSVHFYLHSNVRDSNERKQISASHSILSLRIFGAIRLNRFDDFRPFLFGTNGHRSILSHLFPIFPSVFHTLARHRHFSVRKHR